MGAEHVYKLKHWCDKIVRDPELLPEDKDGNKLGDKKFKPPVGRTFCNFAVQRICHALDYDNLASKNANQMYDYVSANWSRCHEEDAVKAALLGDIVLAAWKNPGKAPNNHGHVAIVYPEKQMVFSGKWNCYTVKVANVGGTNGIMGANYAFAERPEFFRAMMVTQ